MTKRRLSAGARCVALVLLSLLLHIPGFIHQLFDPDESTIAVGGRALARGYGVYVDVIDRKPPLPSVLYSLFAHSGPVDLRWPHLVVALGLGLAAYVLSTDPLVRHGLTAGVFFLFAVVTFLPDNGQSANYAHIAVIFGTCAMVFSRRTGAGAAILAGVFLALAVMSRQTWLIGIVPAACSVWMAHRRVRSVSVLVGAWVITLLAVSWPFGFANIAHWVVAGNGGFLSSTPDFAQFWASLGGNLAQILGLHVGFIVLIVAAVWLRRSADGRQSVLPIVVRHGDLVLWFLTACVAWVSGFRFFGHYAIQALPPVALVAARAFEVLKPRIARIGASAIAVGAVGSVILALFPTAVRTLPNPHPLAAYVDDHSSGRDAVLLWGNFPEVYWQADRLPGGAAITADLVTGLSGNRTAGRDTWAAADPWAQKKFFESMARHVPRLIVDTSSAHIRQYAAYPITEFPALHRVVEQCYTRDATVDGSVVYRLKSANCVEHSVLK